MKIDGPLRIVAHLNGMKRSLYPLLTALMAGALLADIAPSGCGKRNPGPPIRPIEETIISPGSETPGIPKLENETQPQG
jgi:hypothetical protein